MVVYVNGMLFLFSPRDSDARCRGLEKSVDYKDPAAPLQRYLGALYHFNVFDPYKPKAPRSLLASMDDYGANAVQRFKVEFQEKLTRVTSPYITPRMFVKKDICLVGSPSRLLAMSLFYCF